MARKRSEAAAKKPAARKPKRLSTEEAERKVNEMIERPQQGSVLDRPLPHLGKGYSEVCDRVFSLDDPAAELEALIAGLRSDGQLERGVLEHDLNESQDYARRAHRLFVHAKVTLKEFEHDCAEVDAAIRDAAKATLEQQKKDGRKTKMITDADVVAEMAQQFPDAWSTIQSRKERAKRMVDHLERLAELYQQRCNDIRQILKGRG